MSHPISEPFRTGHVNQDADSWCHDAPDASTQTSRVHAPLLLLHAAKEQLESVTCLPCVCPVCLRVSMMTFELRFLAEESGNVDAAGNFSIQVSKRNHRILGSILERVDGPRVAPAGSLPVNAPCVLLHASPSPLAQPLLSAQNSPCFASRATA